MSGVRTILLKDICNFEKGSTGLMKAMPGEYPLVATGADRRSCESYQFDTKAVCIPLVSSTGHGHASLNHVHYQEGKFALGTILVAITAKNEVELNVHFLHLYLSQLKDIVLVPLMKGAANVSLSITAIKNVKISLPSINRQKEIVDKFKSIVKEEKELISELSLQQNLLTSFRQQVLNDGISGKLTSGWRMENTTIEDAETLLKRISADRKSLLIESKIKKQKKVPIVEKHEEPFELPVKWKWCRLGDVASFLNGYAFKSESFTMTGIKLLRNKNISHGTTDWSNSVYLPQDMASDYEGFSLSRGDIVLSLDRPIISTGLKAARISEADLPALLLQRVLLINPITVNSDYLFNWLFSDLFIKSINPGRSIGIPHISHFEVMNTMFPLPPISEQIEINRKIHLLMDSCSFLKKQILQNQENAKILMPIVLNEEF